MSDYQQAKAAAENLAKLNRRRTAEDWTRRAWNVVKDQGPIEEADSRITAYLEARMQAAMEREALQVRVEVFRHSGRTSDEDTEHARARIKREGGISHDHAVELGYESVSHFLEGRPWNEREESDL